jgi:hypothetical protein
VILEQTDDRLALTFVVDDGKWENAELVKAFQNLGDEALAKVFELPAGELRLADQRLKVQKTLVLPQPPRKPARGPVPS